MITIQGLRLAPGVVARGPNSGWLRTFHTEAQRRSTTGSSNIYVGKNLVFIIALLDTTGWAYVWTWSLGVPFQGWVDAWSLRRIA